MDESCCYPIIYEENKIMVLADLKEGRLDYLDSSEWSFQDKFFGFLLGIGFFEVCGVSYPSPRKKEEVPLWFLLACQVQMKLHTTASFERLPFLLRSGAILSRVKFNVGGVNGGFNNKNRKERESAVHHDTPRKFFKDTDCGKMRDWHNQEVVRFFRRNRGFDKHGIFLLDQTHVVVPDNDNYKDAVWMPVDEHGQRIDMSGMTEEQKKVVKYHRCYALSELLHVEKDAKSFLFAGYQWGSGNTDELTQGIPLVRGFVDAVGKGVMELLIMDRGYIDGGFVTMVKNELEADVLMPLRSNMDILLDAQRIAEKFHYKWEKYDEYTKHETRYLEEVVVVEEMQTWDKCEVPLYVSLMKITASDDSVKVWGIATTFKPKNAKEVFDIYALRTQIEERHRQLKSCWGINHFTSPDKSLIEAHVLFTLLTYSLIQLYLTKTHLNQLANKTILSLRQEERIGKDNVIVYSGKYFAVFDQIDYIEILVDLKEEARLRLQKWVKQFKQRDKLRKSGPFP
ncbi:MAG: transposase [Candidatus Edwardsbacteria bacterium]